MKKRKPLSLLLCLALALTLLPGAARADGTPRVLIAGATLSAGTPYYFNTGKTSAEPEDEGAPWNAYLELSGGAYVLHLKGLTVNCGQSVAVQVIDIPKLYVELEDSNTILVSASGADAPQAVSAAACDLVLNGPGSLTVNTAGGVGIQAQSLTLQAPAGLTVDSVTTAISAGAKYLTDAYTLSSNGSSLSQSVYWSSYDSYAKLKFTPVNNTPFPVWVGDERVTSDNQNDVLGGGTVSYVPARGSAPAVLTLSGAAITAFSSFGGQPAGIRAETDPLRIHLAGVNSIGFTSASGQTASGIYSQQDLTITAESGASLTIRIEAVITSAAGFGIYSEQDLTIAGGSVSASASAGVGQTSAGLYAPNGTLCVTGGTVTADCEPGNPAVRADAFALGAGLAVLTPDGGAWVGTLHGVADSGGAAAKTVVLGAPPPPPPPPPPPAYDDTAYYSLRFEANGGGAISPVTRSEYTTVDLAGYTPVREGYVFTGWYADKALTQPAASVRLTKDTAVYAGWRWSSPFADVGEGDWFCDDVEYVYENGLLQGTADAAFSPYRTMTRSMLVTVLWRMAGSPAPADGGSGFADLTEDWYAGAVSWAAQKQLVGGYGAARFGPGDPVTRGQLVAMLYRFAVSRGDDVSVGEDTNILSYDDALDLFEGFIPAFQWACGAGLVQGNGGRLMPQAPVTRGQAAAILHRFAALS